MKAKPVKIALTQGKFALVDKRDAKRVNKHKWYAKKPDHENRTFYAARSARVKGSRKKAIRMHRFIINAQPGQMIDHVDGDGLNNTRKNLRFATQTQNHFNCHARRSNTGFLGVCKVSGKRKKRYLAKLQSEKKRVLYKRFYNKYEAAAMYDHVKRSVAGEYGSYNFDALLSANQMRNRIYKCNGIFSVVFKTRFDDSLRHMTARMSVTKYLKGGTVRFDPHKKRLVTVFDMTKQLHRLIPIDGMIALKINGKYYGRRPKD
ncbi:MAG: HNH endonuclease [Planctomycetes bacterium]|nr:HNH endonuclease [Planctomycetota bacterium]